ncbi:hypothetical protein VTK26DRAFT_4318 [Humicola hyalothermophila]
MRPLIFPSCSIPSESLPLLEPHLERLDSDRLELPESGQPQERKRLLLEQSPTPAFTATQRIVRPVSLSVCTVRAQVVDLVVGRAERGTAPAESATHWLLLLLLVVVVLLLESLVIGERGLGEAAVGVGLVGRVTGEIALVRWKAHRGLVGFAGRGHG